jgi:PhnB protein
MRMPVPGGKVGHAEITIGDSVIMLSDEAPEMGARGPRAFGGSPVSIHLYVEDVDVTVKAVEDPFGHHWHVATHREDVSPEEMARRAAGTGKSAAGM